MNSKGGSVNLPIALASLAISLILWVVVLPEHLSNATRPLTIPLTSHGLPPEFCVDKMPNSIVVRAKVSDQEYNDLIIEKDLHAEVDLSDPKTGNNPYRSISVYPPRLQQLVKEIDSPVMVSIEKSKKQDFPVTATSTGRISDPNLHLDDLELETKRVEIDGPESEVNKVVSVQATLQLDMVDPHAPQPTEAILEPFDAENHLVANLEMHPEKVFILPKLAPSPQNKIVFIDPRFIGRVPDGYVVKGYSINPDRITASGPNLILKGVAKLSTGPIDISQLTSTQTLTAPILVPPGLTVGDAKEVQVTITIQPIMVKSLNPSSEGAKPSKSTNGP